jgi:hypothetical protein
MKVFGRDEVIKEALSALKHGQSVVLYGIHDAGLTTISRQVLRRLCEEGIEVAYLPSVRHEKPLWQDLAFQLSCEEEKRIFAGGGRSLTTDALAGMVRSKIRSIGGVVMILDCEDGLPAEDTNVIKALCGLHSLGVAFLVAVHTLNEGKSFLQRLGRPIEIHGLPEKDACAFIEYLTEGWSLEDLGDIQQTLFKKTHGYPGLIEKALKPYQETWHLTNEMADRIEVSGTSEARYLYPWVCIPLTFLLVFNKYLSRVAEGGGDRVSYVLGSLGLVASFFFLRFVLPILRKK